MIKNIRLAVIILFGLILVDVDWSVAGVDDILQKQQKKEQHEVKEKEEGRRLTSALYKRNLEFFNAVVSAIVDLQKKGVKFETRTEDILTIEGKKFVNLAGEKALLLSIKANNSVIMRGNHFAGACGEGFWRHDCNIEDVKNRGLYFIEFEPNRGKAIKIKTDVQNGELRVKMEVIAFRGYFKEMKFPIFDEKAISSNRDTIINSVFEMVEESLNEK